VAGPVSFETSNGRQHNQPTTLAQVFNIANARAQETTSDPASPEPEPPAAQPLVATGIKPLRPGVHFIVDDLHGTVVRRNSLQSRPPKEFRVDDSAIPQTVSPITRAEPKRQIPNPKPRGGRSPQCQGRGRR
jgi:hypothetical protein